LFLSSKVLLSTYNVGQPVDPNIPWLTGYSQNSS